MKKELRRLMVLLLFPVFMLLQSCGTTYVVEIKPVGVETFVESGRVVATQAKSGVETYLTFLDNPPGMMIFDVQVANKSGYPLNVKPTNIFLVPMANLNDRTNPANAVNAIHALDPSTVVSNIRKEMESEKSGYKAGVVLDIGLTILGAIIYSAAEDDEKPEVYADMAGGLVARRIDAAVDHDRFMEDLEYRKNYIDAHSLKDTVLNKEGHVYGAVMLPLKALPKYFSIVIPIDGSYFEFPYQVIVREK